MTIPKEVLELSLTDEEWRPMPNGFGLYFVSSLGRVVSMNDRRRSFKVKMLKPGIGSLGYAHVTVNHAGAKRIIKVHRAVALAFIENPDALPCINHKNEIKTDNRVSNLEWCTVKYNTNYGTGMKRNAEKQRNTKKTRKPIIAIAPDGTETEYQSIRDCQRILGVNQSHISKAARGIRYRTIHGYRFKFK